MKAQVIDVCLGCYLTDHHNRDGELLLGASVDGDTTHEEVREELLAELNARAIDDESFDYEAARKEIDSMFDGVELADPFDPNLETVDPEERDLYEPCQVWVLLSWDA